jgi:hypothetical protein
MVVGVVVDGHAARGNPKITEISSSSPEKQKMNGSFISALKEHILHTYLDAKPSRIPRIEIVAVVLNILKQLRWSHLTQIRNTCGDFDYVLGCVVFKMEKALHRCDDHLCWSAGARCCDPVRCGLVAVLLCGS